MKVKILDKFIETDFIYHVGEVKYFVGRRDGSEFDSTEVITAPVVVKVGFIIDFLNDKTVEIIYREEFYSDLTIIRSEALEIKKDFIRIRKELIKLIQPSGYPEIK